MACHTLSVWGAPKLGDSEAWSGRIAKGKPALYASALNGLDKMPVRGYCQFCTDIEIKKAVDYIVSKAQPRQKERGSAGSEH
jgi:cytochrome c5